MADIIVPNTLAYMVAIRQLFDDGKVSLEQYAECLRKYSEIINKKRQKNDNQRTI